MLRGPLTIVAPAKLNLTLDILATLPQGYHAVRMVLQSVDLCDRVTLLQGEGEISVHCPGFLPQGEENIVHRAALAFFEAAGRAIEAVELHIEKSIPVAAGLGGGSADAAAVLLGLNAWTGSPLSQSRLLETASLVGADVPFCLLGGTMLAEGFGEKLRPLAPMPDGFLVLVHAGKKDSTGAMYARFDQLAQRPPEQTGSMLRALEQGNLGCVAGALGNAFEGLSNVEQGKTARRILIEAGALGCSLSGSGPTVYGVFARQEDARIAKNRCIQAGFVSHICRPLARGCHVEGENLPPTVLP